MLASGHNNKAMSIPSSGSNADPFLWGKVLKCVEDSGGITKVKGGLNNICFTGERAQLFPENQRKDLRRKWDNAKQSSISHWVKICGEHGVTPCVATMQEYMKETSQKKSKKQKQAARQKVARAPSSDSSEEDCDLTEGMQGLGLDETTPSAKTPMRHRSTSYGGSPPPSKARTGSSRHSSRRSFALDGSSDDNESFVSDVAPVALYGGGTGVASNPFKWLVDIRRPEMNPAELLIKRVPRGDGGTHEHNTWVFSLVTLLPDAGCYELRHVSDSSVLLKKPTHSHMQKASVKYNASCHDYNNTVANPYTENEAEKNADAKHELAVSNDPNRQHFHFLLELPVTKALNNQILTGGSIDAKIPREVRKVKSTEFPGVTAVELTWRIAEEGGEQVAPGGGAFDPTALLNA